MPALYKPGEKVGPGTVVSDEFTILEDGRTIEHVVTSWGQQMLMHGVEDDRSYREVDLPERRGGILVPYTKRDEDTMRSLPSNAEWVYVGGSPYDYWSVLCDYWKPDYDLIICEHDITWRYGISKGFTSCGKVWCNHKYDEHNAEDAEAWKWLLGCTRFRKELIAAVPDAVTGIEPRHRDWHYVCDGLGRNLEAAGFEHHWHPGPVEHRLKRNQAAA